MFTRLGISGIAAIAGIASLSCSSVSNDPQPTSGAGGGSSDGAAGTPTADAAPGAGGTAGGGADAAAGGQLGDGAIADACGAQFDYSQANCPLQNASRDVSVMQCLQDHRDYEAFSCDASYDSWVACTGKAPYNCMADTGCEAQQNAYFTCQSRFVAKTGCTRLTPQDAKRCQDPKPYAFGCLGPAPSACVLVVDAGAGIWCCPKLM